MIWLVCIKPVALPRAKTLLSLSTAVVINLHVLVLDGGQCWPEAALIVPGSVCVGDSSAHVVSVSAVAITRLHRAFLYNWYNLYCCGTDWALVEACFSMSPSPQYLQNNIFIFKTASNGNCAIQSNQNTIVVWMAAIRHRFSHCGTWASDTQVISTR